MMSEQVGYKPVMNVQFKNLAHSIFKKQETKKYSSILVTITLIDQDGIKTEKEIEVQIESYDQWLYQKLIDQIQEVLDKYNHSKNFIQRVG